MKLTFSYKIKICCIKNTIISFSNEELFTLTPILIWFKVKLSPEIFNGKRCIKLFKSLWPTHCHRQKVLAIRIRIFFALK